MNSLNTLKLMNKEGKMRWVDIWMNQRNTISEFGLRAVDEVAYCDEHRVLQAIILLLEELRETGEHYSVVDGCLQVFVNDMIIYFDDGQLFVEGENEEECSWLFYLIVRNCPDGKDDISIGRFLSTFVGEEPTFVEEKERTQQRRQQRQRKQRRERQQQGKKVKRRNYRKENRKDFW